MPWDYQVTQDQLSVIGPLLDRQKGHSFDGEKLVIIDDLENDLVKSVLAGSSDKALELAVAGALSDIDLAAENARMKYLSSGVGQALTYMAKAEEIRRYDADTNPVKSDYPFMSAEIGVTGDSLTTVAEVVRATSLAWSEKGSLIERARLKAHKDVRAARTTNSIRDIVSGIDWP